MKTIVLGGGVVGVTTAYYLAKASHEVHLVEREPDVAMGTSARNGGVIHTSEAEPWSRPGMPANIWRWLGKSDAPMLLRYRAIPGMWRWGLEFVRNCNTEDYRRNTKANLRLSNLTLEAVRDINEAEHLDYDRQTNGTMKVYSDSQSFDHMRSESEAMKEFGLQFEIVDTKRAIELEPALKLQSGNLVGGLYFPPDEHGDCAEFTRQLRKKCESMGVTFHTGTNARALKHEKGHIESVVTDRQTMKAERFVVAAGSWTPHLLDPLGVRIPIYPAKGLSITVDADNWPDRLQMPVIDDSRLFGLIPLGSRLRCSGSVEFNGYNATPDRARCEVIVNNVIKAFPEFEKCYDPSTAIYWAGLRPMTPTGTPFIGSTRYDNLFVNCGHNHLGWTLACGSSLVVSRIVDGEDPGIDMDRLSLDRR